MDGKARKRSRATLESNARERGETATLKRMKTKPEATPVALLPLNQCEKEGITSMESSKRREMVLAQASRGVGGWGRYVPG